MAFCFVSSHFPRYQLSEDKGHVLLSVKAFTTCNTKNFQSAVLKAAPHQSPVSHTMVCTLPPLSFSTVSTRLSTSASPFLPCKQAHQYHFYSFRVSVLMYICFSFSDFPSLCITGSRFIHLTRIDFHSFFLWLSTIPLQIHTTCSLSIYLQMTQRGGRLKREGIYV